MFLWPLSYVPSAIKVCPSRQNTVEMGHTVDLKEILYWLRQWRLLKEAIQLSAYSL